MDDKSCRITLAVLGVSCFLLALINVDYKNKIKEEKDKTEQTNQIDTVYVLGKYDFNNSFKARTYIYGVDKAGNEYGKDFDNLADTLSCVHLSYTERGDTLVVQGDRVITNITLENLRAKLIKNR